MWELDYKESWAPKNWCFWTVVLEKTLESPLDCKEIKPVHPKGDQSWVFIGMTDGEAPKLWPPDAKKCLIVKDPVTGKDWRQEEKGMTEDEMAGWHHRLDGHEFEETLGVGDGQGGLACCSPWGRKEWVTRLSDWTWTGDVQGSPVGPVAISSSAVIVYEMNLEKWLNISKPYLLSTWFSSVCPNFTAFCKIREYSWPQSQKYFQRLTLLRACHFAVQVTASESSTLGDRSTTNPLFDLNQLRLFLAFHTSKLGNTDLAYSYKSHMEHGGRIFLVWIQTR